MRTAIAIVLAAMLVQCTSTPSSSQDVQGAAWDSLSFSAGSRNLATGWYFVTSDTSGVQFDWDGQAVFVDTVPILTAGNMIELMIEENTFSVPAATREILVVKLDEVGAAKWKYATGKAVGEHLAGIIRGRLVSFPNVVAQIDGPYLSYSLGEKGKHKNRGMLEVVQADSRVVPPVE